MSKNHTKTSLLAEMKVMNEEVHKGTSLDGDVEQGNVNVGLPSKKSNNNNTTPPNQQQPATATAGAKVETSNALIMSDHRSNESVWRSRLVKSLGQLSFCCCVLFFLFSFLCFFFFQER
jgi:hypothetical protein